MNKLKSRRDYSIEKVLEEVQETQIRESFASRKPQCSENSDELNFRPGYVHLLKNKFSQLSDSKDSNGQKDSLMRKRSRCSEQKQIQSLEIISCTPDTSVIQPVRNESHKPNNLGSEKAEDTSTVVSANQIQNVQFHKPMENNKGKPSLEHMKSSHSSDTSELQELPIKNIVSATRFLFEKLGSNNSIISNTYSSSNDYTPSKVKQDVIQSAPKTKAKSMENLSNTKYSLPRSNSKTIQFSVIKPSSLKLETTVNSVDDPSKPSVRLLNTSSDKVQNLHSNVLTENSSNVKVTDTSPAQDYLPGKKSTNQHLVKDHSRSLSSNTSTKPPAPLPSSKDKEISQDSRWKTFEDIPVPKRRTFVDDAKHVKISKNDLQTSRQGTKSWLFTTDTKKATESEKNVIAVQVKPSIHSSSPTSSKSIFGNNSNHISEERLAQQTFWDAYRSSDSRNFSVLNQDIQDEVDMILKRKDEVSINGDHLMVVDNSVAESKRTLNNTNFKKSSKVKKNIKFAADSNLIEEYEYQSEQSFYEELGIVPEYNLVNNSNNNNNSDEEDDDEDYVFLNPNATGKQPVALSAYQTKASAEFSWSQPIFSEVKTTPPIASPESLQVTPNSETKSPQPDESFSFSDTTHADTDLLF